MNLRKWNRAAHAYEPYEVPDDWDVRCFETDMSAEVNCCQCGRAVAFGETYTSCEVHTPVGFGYVVCYDCHVAEIARERMWREERDGKTRL